MGTAVVALIAGALGAGIAGLLQLRRDRVETLRQRQLDAADAFAAATARVLLQVKLVLDTHPKQTTEPRIDKWREDASEIVGALRREVQEVAAHTPRVELLFGVKSPASVAALQTTFDLTEMANALQPPVNEEAFAWAYKLAAAAALRFHDEANMVVAASWWRRRRHKAIPDEAFDELVARFTELDSARDRAST
jgi:hypothetical protein